MDAHKDASDGHVHFNETDVSGHQSDIHVVPAAGDLVEVHLGFLQIRHIYSTTFSVPHALGPDVTCDPLESLHAKVTEMRPSSDGHELVVEFHANKEKLMKEKVTLRSATSDDLIFLVFHARVLGKHKGTPSLRKGIHCVRIEPDEDDDTDWQGFN